MATGGGQPHARARGSPRIGPDFPSQVAPLANSSTLPVGTALGWRPWSAAEAMPRLQWQGKVKSAPQVRSLVSQAPAALVALVAQHNALDLELHRWVAARFEQAYFLAGVDDGVDGDDGVV